MELWQSHLWCLRPHQRARGTEHELIVPEQTWIQDYFSFKEKQEKSLFLDVSNLMWTKYNISDPVSAGLQADPEQAGSSTNSQFSFSLRHYAEKLMDPRVKSYFTPAQSQSISLTLFTLHWNRNLEWQDHYHQRKGNLGTGHQFAWYKKKKKNRKASWEQTTGGGAEEGSGARAAQGCNHADWIWRYHWATATYITETFSQPLEGGPLPVWGSLLPSSLIHSFHFNPFCLWI